MTWGDCCWFSGTVFCMVWRACCWFSWYILEYIMVSVLLIFLILLRTFYSEFVAGFQLLFRTSSGELVADFSVTVSNTLLWACCCFFWSFVWQYMESNVTDNSETWALTFLLSTYFETRKTILNCKLKLFNKINFKESAALFKEYFGIQTSPSDITLNSGTNRIGVWDIISINGDSVVYLEVNPGHPTILHKGNLFCTPFKFLLTNPFTVLQLTVCMK